MKQRTIELSFNNREEMFIFPINPAELEFTEPHNNQRITLLNIGEVSPDIGPFTKYPPIGNPLETGNSNQWLERPPVQSYTWCLQ